LSKKYKLYFQKKGFSISIQKYKHKFKKKGLVKSSAKYKGSFKKKGLVFFKSRTSTTPINVDISNQFFTIFLRDVII
jgi:hypothetical protein